MSFESIADLKYREEETLPPAARPRIASGGGWRRLRDAAEEIAASQEIEPVSLSGPACGRGNENRLNRR